MRSSLTSPAVLAALLFAGACGDDQHDSIEASYARALCEHNFACYPDIRRAVDDDIESCIGLQLSQYERSVKSSGDACGDAMLYQWACASQVECNVDNDTQGPCGSTLTRIKIACPDASMSP